MSVRKTMRRFAVMLSVVSTVSLLFCCSAQCAKNIILMIGDGMGPEQVKAGSYYLYGKAGKMCFEPYYKCNVTTYSKNAAVTDSAAAATTMATGHKTNNGMLSESPAGIIYETILEKAKAMGKRTGLVTTVAITDATPAGFGAHNEARSNWLQIGDYYISNTQPNVLFGGGDPAKDTKYFSNELVQKAQTTGYKTVFDAAQFNSIDPATTDHVLGLFAKDDMTYECDRKPDCKEPHLYQMAEKALQIVSRDPKGFFLMVEGGSIDHGGHKNNIKIAAGEAAGFNKAVQTVLNWMNGRNDTLLIVTADHETGGLKATNKGVGQYPDATWTTTGHTNTNVPLYTTGADCNLVNSFIKNGVIDDTNINTFMNAAFAVSTN